MFKCEDCDDVKYLLIDGYNFADRLLEGITFEIRTLPDSEQTSEKKYSVKVIDDDKDYFYQFNESMWLERTLEFAHETDNGICPKCEVEVIINE